MDQQIINWLFIGFGAATGWILKVIWDAIRDLKNDLREIEKDLPEVYVRNDTGKEYPWPALEIAEGRAKQALEGSGND